MIMIVLFSVLCVCMMTKLRKVIAVDFDGTLCELGHYPEIGNPIPKTISKLKEKQKEGYAIILNTCRYGKALENAVEWCKEQGILFDAVNENLKERIDFFGGDCRKISADEYWDDRAINPNNI